MWPGPSAQNAGPHVPCATVLPLHPREHEHGCSKQTGTRLHSMLHRLQTLPQLRQHTCVSVVASLIAKGTLTRRASVLASSVLPQPVGPWAVGAEGRRSVNKQGGQLPARPVTEGLAKRR